MAKLADAQQLHAHGWRVVAAPLAGKAPLGSWKSAQTEPATEEELKTAFSKDRNIFIITGAISRLAVLDCDDHQAIDYWRERLGDVLDETACVSTGRGKHFYFRLAEGETHKGRSSPGGDSGKWDIRCEAGGVVAPPSIHPSGRVYRWARGRGPEALRDAPAELWAGEKKTAKEKAGPSSLLSHLLANPPDEGGRNNWLTRVAGHYAVELKHLDAFEETVRGLGQGLGLEDEEIEKLIKSIWGAEQAKRAAKEHRRTDLGNSELFAEQHADYLRFVPQQRTWLAQDGVRWKPDVTGDAERAAKETARSLLSKAAQIEDPEERQRAVRWAMQSESGQRIKEMMRLGSTAENIAITIDKLDSDPWLLTCPNGTIDLRTGELRAHSPDDLITMWSPVPYDAQAPCELWLKTLDEIFAGDEDLIAFLQRFVGYALTGVVREHVLVFFHGSGRNGKDTFLTAIQGVLGDHATTAEVSTFLRSYNEDNKRPRNDIARLRRARLVSASESGKGKRLDEATIKEITGGGRVTARFLHKEHFTFTPTFKLVLISNHKPKVDGEDFALWARLHLVPFEVNFKGREDTELGEKLAAEAPGILAWAVRGCLDWQRHGLGSAKVIEEATRGYQYEEDSLGAFLDSEGVERDATAETHCDTFRKAYETFCEEIGEVPLASNVLGRRLAKRGTKKIKRTICYRGVRLL